jgi:hypothetical protein
MDVPSFKTRQVNTHIAFKCHQYAERRKSRIFIKKRVIFIKNGRFSPHFPCFLEIRSSTRRRDSRSYWSLVRRVAHPRFGLRNGSKETLPHGGHEGNAGGPVTGRQGASCRSPRGAAAPVGLQAPHARLPGAQGSHSVVTFRIQFQGASRRILRARRRGLFRIKNRANFPCKC